jgi:hypothetical protein
MATRPAPRRFPLSIAGIVLSLAGCTSWQPSPFPEPAPPPVPELTPAQKGMKPLSAGEVKAILNNARYRWQGAQGATGTAMTTPDGRIRVIWEDGAVNGRIRFNEFGYCSRFEKNVRNGIEDCYRLYRTGPRDFIVVRQDGMPSGTISLIN